MAQLKSPQNFTVIRSEDRVSALLFWDSVIEDIEGTPAAPVLYSVYQTERNNTLGYAVVKDVPHTASVPRQFTSLDGLDPDMLYTFKVTAVDNTDTESEPSSEATDF